jgi:hypothetical protein
VDSTQGIPAATTPVMPSQRCSGERGVSATRAQVGARIVQGALQRQVQVRKRGETGECRERSAESCATSAKVSERTRIKRAAVRLSVRAASAGSGADRTKRGGRAASDIRNCAGHSAARSMTCCVIAAQATFVSVKVTLAFRSTASGRLSLVSAEASAPDVTSMPHSSPAAHLSCRDGSVAANAKPQ